MQKNSSENASPGAGNALKYILIAFVAVSVGAVIYKNLPCCSGDKAVAVPVQTAAAVEAVGKVPVAVVKKTAAVNTAITSKTAVVYYFYTDTRCSSCKTIEAYTREAVATKLAAGYKDWQVEFKGVNVDDDANKHFVQDYWLNSKSVVVQKFAGDKPLKWGKLDKVWQLLGDKEGFINYVVGETEKLLDQK